MVCKYYLTRQISDAPKNSAKLSFWDHHFYLSHVTDYIITTQLKQSLETEYTRLLEMNWVNDLLNKEVGRVHRYAVYAFQYSYQIDTDTDMLLND